MASIAVVIPTHNAGNTWSLVLKAIQKQSIKVKEIVVLDIESTNSTINIAEDHFARVIPIFAKDWDPWFTRQWAASQTKESDIVVYLSQDCILDDYYSLEQLVDKLISKNSYMVYGRQKCGHDAPPNIKQIYKSFFPTHNLNINEIEKLLPAAMRLCVYYHAFAAYFRKKLLKFNYNLPNKVIAADDIIVMDHLLKNQETIDYCPKAAVLRSPTPSIKQYFQQSIDRGVSYYKEKNNLSFTDRDTGVIRKFLPKEKNLTLDRDIAMKKLIGVVYLAAQKIGYQIGKHNPSGWSNRDRNKDKGPLRGLT
ncbi:MULTISPECIES: glycosyltransferase family A protein [Candidatus Ichthyocystis]|uniref:glycosyltransferase family A protein n=1 Tax=Candidatus Ichthyocystis TaxID=2929841 RepID=UPI000B8387A9|nr:MULTISPECIES: glycosyltransferase family 2 protein [Ichthyocystis]